jgi:Fe-S cluster assembly ATP-binding protein
MLTISQLSVAVQDVPVLRGFDLTIKPGTVHALLGPNGSGKSSLAMALMGHPTYNITQGDIIWNNANLLSLQPHERARAGLFLAAQHPLAIPGVRVTALLREACRAVQGNLFNESTFKQELAYACELLEINTTLRERSLNDGFSGGEKKRFELLQMLMLRRQLVILDEIDSGLDIDALKIVGAAVAYAQQQNPTISFLIITHYQRLLQHITLQHAHIMINGRIVASGSADLVMQLEARGYESYATQ